MKCQTVRTRLPGYLDDVVTGAARVEERTEIREHLEGLQRLPHGAGKISASSTCYCPAFLRTILLADLAVRIKVAAAQAQRPQDWPGRLRRMKDRAEILVDNVFRPLDRPSHRWLFLRHAGFRAGFSDDCPGITGARGAKRPWP